MAKEIICTDFDNVVVDYYYSFAVFAELKLGKRVHYDDWHHFPISVTFGLTPSQEKELFEAFTAEVDQYSIPALPGAIDAILQLRRTYEVIVVTARMDRSREVTERWLADNLPGVSVEYSTVAHKKGETLVYETERPTKLEIAERLGAICHIDDRPMEFHGWESETVQPICFAHPWNACLIETHPHIPRLQWPEIVAHHQPA